MTVTLHGGVEDSTRRRRRRWPRRFGAVTGLVVVAYIALTVAYFVEPDLGSVHDPQAVVVLAGYGNRVSHAVAVARADHVGLVVVSAPLGHPCPGPLRSVPVVCFDPRPASTEGEARSIAALARQYGWSRLLVVAGTTQVTRARLRIGRCFSGDIAFSSVDPSGVWGWVQMIAYDQAAMVEAEVWQRNC